MNVKGHESVPYVRCCGRNPFFVRDLYRGYTGSLFVEMSAVKGRPRKINKEGPKREMLLVGSAGIVSHLKRMSTRSCDNRIEKRRREEGGEGRRRNRTKELPRPKTRRRTREKLTVLTSLSGGQGYRNELEGRIYMKTRQVLMLIRKKGEERENNG